MRFTPNNLKTCLAAPGSIYAQWRDEHAALGFRTISLSVAGSVSVPIYTAIMVKLATPFRGRSDPSMTLGELQSMIADLANDAQPLHPYILSATGSGSSIVYAAAFRALSEAPVVRPNLTAAQFKAENAVQREAGRMPIWLDSFGSANDIRYCGIWSANRDHVAWSANALNDSGDARQQRFEAMVSMGARPAMVAVTPQGGVARLFVDSALKHSWIAKPPMLGDAFQQLMEKEKKLNRFPVSIGTEVIDNAVRYSGVFQQSDEVVARTFRKRGVGSVPLNAANAAKAAKLDEWMEKYVKAHAQRGAAIAVVEGTRLVFTRGYSFAEPGYPDTEPTTLFRLASVSKTFGAIAAWKALHDDPKVSRNSKMQDILQLTPLPAGAALPGNFGKITVRHLLESCSGLDQNGMRGSMAKVRDETEDAQPVPAATLARMIAGLPMTGQPGGATAYGRTDYWMLGLIAAKLSNTPSFDAALKKLVLDPLKMTRTRGSKSKMEQRAPDEAIHHAPDLATSRSAVHTDRRIVPGHYGGENYDVFDAPGGVSSAAVDLARLLAMLSCRTGNPVLPPATIDDFLTDAVAATSAGSDHGYHGFDAASGSLPHVSLRKGGSLPGVRTGFDGEVGQRFIIMLRNCEGVEGATPSDWKKELDDLAKAVDWGNGDLFPQFGMPALG
jgi:CubicO group peptidase (beta-lactamase class C family)